MNQLTKLMILWLIASIVFLYIWVNHRDVAMSIPEPIRTFLALPMGLFIIGAAIRGVFNEYNDN